MVELSSQDRDIITCISEGMPDYQVMVRCKVTLNEIEAALQRVRDRAGFLDDGSNAAVFYERALRRRAENAAESLKARFHTLMDASSEAILVVNGRTGIILEINQNAVKMFGYSPEELVGQQVEILVPDVPEHVHTAYRVGFLASVRKRYMGYHPPIFALKKDGSPVAVAIGLTASSTDDDVMVVCSDQYRDSPSESSATDESVATR